MSTHLSLANILLEEFSFMHCTQPGAVDHKDGEVKFHAIHNVDDFVNKLVSPTNSVADTPYQKLFEMLTRDTRDTLRRYENRSSLWYSDICKDDIHAALVSELNDILENIHPDKKTKDETGFFQLPLWCCTSGKRSSYIAQLTALYDDKNLSTSQLRYIRRLALTDLFSPFLPWPFMIDQLLPLEAVQQKLMSLSQGPGGTEEPAFQTIYDLDALVEKLVSPTSSADDTPYSILFGMLEEFTQDKLLRYAQYPALMRLDTRKKEVHAALISELNHIHKITDGFFQRTLWKCTSAKTSHYITQLMAWHDEKNCNPCQAFYIKQLALSALFSPFLSEVSLEAALRTLESLPEGRSALCISGGGIRSATFALGLMQSLVRLNLMKRFDYLSTVSGGGYIGSWLSACIKEVGRDHVFKSLGQAPCDRKNPIEHPLDSDPKEIAHIRRFRNYLIPNWGLFSPDAWTLVATYCRNLFLNWLTLIPALVCVLALARLDVLFLLTEDIPGFGVCGGFWIGTALTIWSIGFLSYHLRSTRIEASSPHQQPDRGAQQVLFQTHLLMLGLAPLTWAGIVLALFWAWSRMYEGMAITCGADIFQSGWNGSGLNSWLHWDLPMPFEVHPANFALYALFVHFAGVLVSKGLDFILGCTKTQELDKRKEEEDAPLPLRILSLIVASLASGLATYLAATNLFFDPRNTPFAYAVFAVPLLLTILLLGLDILVGLQSRWWTDSKREQKARLNGFVLRVCLVWIVISFLVLYGPLWFTNSGSMLWSSAGGISGLLALFLGFSGGTKATPKGEEKESRLDVIRRITLSVAAPIGVMFVVILISGLTSFVILKTGPTLHSWLKSTPNVMELRKLGNRILTTPFYAEPMPPWQMNTAGSYEDFFIVLVPKPFPLIQVQQLATRLQSVKEPYDNCEMVAMLQYLDEKFAELNRTRPEASKISPKLDGWKEQARKAWPDVDSYETQALGPLCGLKQEAAISFRDFVAVHDRVVTETPGYVLWCLFGGCLLLVLSMPFATSINTFSLHCLYRERLVRTFLGASRKRNPDAFTGLDQDDNFAMADLARSGIKPFHVVNTAINLLSTENQAWTNRKAASFTFSPLHSGSPVPSLGYRRSEEYGKNKAIKQSITLGTALAISGSAASPNMGYHSSPAVTFLMTLFNVRLGWWLGNPGPAGDSRHWGWGINEAANPSWQRSTPRFPLLWWFKEALGQTREDNAYVYLSDGGHFENLGLYEMVLRRCRFIVVSDAGCDPTYSFEDLGNALRKIRVDLGIEIEIDLEMVRPQAGQRLCRWHHAIGVIRYDKVDKYAHVGILVYIKASLTGDELADVQEYASAHVEFPHQTTGDQFFDESQFESYRQLGEQIAREVFNPIASLALDEKKSVPEIFYALRSHWITLPPGIKESFLEETKALVDIEQQLRNDPNLLDYDTQLYPELKTILGIRNVSVVPGGIAPPQSSQSGQKERSLLHICHTQIQLMENVFLAVQLDKYHAHPLNCGWMNLFRRWAAADDFQRLWPVLRGGFSKTFVEFADTELNLGNSEQEVICEVTRNGAGVCQSPIAILPDCRHSPAQLIDFAPMIKEFAQEWPDQTRRHDFLRSFQKAGKTNHPPIIVAVPPQGVEINSQLFGIAFAINANQTAKPEPGWRIFIWVRGAHRRLGIGGKLLDQLLKTLPPYLGVGRGRKLIVILPELPRERPGYALEKAGWLHFFGSRRFRLVDEEKGLYRLERFD